MARKRKLIHPVIRHAALALPLLFLAVFFFYPLGTIASFSLRQLDPSRPVLPRYFGRVFWFTTWQATLSTILTLVVGLPGAHLFARYRFPGKSLLQAVITIPFVLPTLIVATAFLSLLGPNGVINSISSRFLGAADPVLDLQHSLALVLLAHVFYNYSVVHRVVGSFWSHLNPRLNEAARTLGASRWQAWWRITLAQLAPAIGAAAMLVFMFCFTSFGVIMVLGGPRFATLEVEIYRQAVSLLNLPAAALIAGIQTVLTFGLMSGYTALQRRISLPRDLQSRKMTEHSPSSWSHVTWLVLNSVLIVGLLLAPLAALVWRSVTLGGEFSFGSYRALTRDPGRSIFYTHPLIAVRNSVIFAAIAVALSLALGTLSAYLLSSKERWLQRALVWLDPLFVLPLGTSAVTLGFGYIIAFGRLPLNWITSPLLVPVVHSLIAFPFVLRSILPALRGIRPSIREAAATLGATPLRTWRSIDLPLLARPLAVGAVFAFTVSIGEFGATLLIARTEYATIPVVLYRYLSQPGLINMGQALAMSTLLMTVCTVSFVLIEQFRVRSIGSF
jgi:thiamine transport system permease protein